MKRIAKFIFAGVMSAMVTGCAVMSEEECRSTNWYERGYADGTKGVGSHMLREYIDACHKVVAVDQNGYMRGRREGAEVYCTNENAFSLGTQNTSVSDICSVSSNANNVNKYYKRGHAVCSAREYLAKIDEYINVCSEYSVSMDSRRLREQLRANQNYLSNLRYDVENYVNYVEEHAYNGGITLRDYSSEINRMPYPDAIKIANNIAEGERKYEESRREAERYMDDARHCMKEANRKDDGEKYNRCHDKYNCWKDRAHELHRAYEGFLYEAERGSTSSYYPRHVRSCSTHIR